MKYEYDAILHEIPENGGAYVAFPWDIRAVFGRGRVKVHAQFDGVGYDGSIVNMGVKDAEGSSYQRRLCVAVSNNSTTPTAVRSIAAGTENPAAQYNLAGQRVDNAYQGIVVVKGKKGYKRSK